MGLFSRKKKREEELSQLPKLPDLPEMPRSNRAIPEAPANKPSALPTFPDSHLGEEINQGTIKEAVTQKEEQNTRPNIPTLPTNPITPEQIPTEPQEPRTREISGQQMQQAVPFQQPIVSEERPPIIKKSEPLFIKLDKFEGAISTFNETKMRISELESALKNVRELKIKEEQELGEWEKELETIKSRLEKIDRDLFNKV